MYGNGGDDVLYGAEGSTTHCWSPSLNGRSSCLVPWLDCRKVQPSGQERSQHGSSA
ncbi:hypothetical protein ACUTAF_10210 [Pseudomonas sp. SP16.1]|uniref:hypothetical protein n=1 Tax=Pseudomonas sp. SP16.1 TaxID=3458854 RepID=UPI0040452490